MPEARSEAKKTTASATSPGCTSRRSAVRAMIRSSTSATEVPCRRASRAMVSVFISEATAPGQTALTLTPAGPTSRASDWVRPITPNFEAQ